MVSIILVNYNGAKDTIDCIQSLNNIDYDKYEIIVVDNKSTDDSLEVLKEFQRDNGFVLLEARENNGFSAGNNIGIEYALKNNSEYVVLLNNDTTVEIDFLQKLINAFSYSENCGATIGKIMLYSKPDVIWYAGGDVNLRTSRTRHYYYGEKDNNDTNSQVVTFATGCCLCLKKECIEKIGLLDERYFLYEEDVEYSIRLKENNYDIVYTPESIIYHKVSASTGESSPMSQYYLVRNKYSLIRDCFKGMNKFVAYNYATLQFVVRCIKRKLKFRNYIKGTVAFLKKERGKTTRSFK